MVKKEKEKMVACLLKAFFRIDGFMEFVVCLQK